MIIFISVLIPQVPLSFNCLSINRQDGSCNAHNIHQVDFAKIIQSNYNAITQLESDKCNQNIDYNNISQCNNQADRMSQSVHEARNHIFDIEDNLKISDRKRKRLDNRNNEKILPQLAYALDPCYGVLYVFDAIAKKMLCYNVIASEIPNNVEYSANLKAILSSDLALPQKSDVQITRGLASINLLACLDILTSAQDSM